MIQLWLLAVPAKQLKLFTSFLCHNKRAEKLVASFLCVIILQQKERGYIKSTKS